MGHHRPAGTSLNDFIISFVRAYLGVPEHNNLGPGSKGTAWTDFLVGFSSASDPLYEELKEHVGPFHWTPVEAYTHGQETGKETGRVTAEELSVVSWALCQSEEAKAGNRRETRHPSEAWARARVFGQRCNTNLHTSLVAALAAQGHDAVAPALLPCWSEQPSDRYFVASTWSERHIAYVCGLGTFGLSGGLITEKGQAVRFGSLVVRGFLEPTPRPYNGPFDYCLFLSRGACGRCVERCPAGSVREEGRDKAACSRYLGPANAAYVETNFGFKGYGCGLCQTGVPCESRVPQADELEHE